MKGTSGSGCGVSSCLGCLGFREGSRYSLKLTRSMVARIVPWLIEWFLLPKPISKEMFKTTAEINFDGLQAALKGI